MKKLGKILLGFAIVSVASMISAAIVRSRNPEFGDEEDGTFSVVASPGGREFASTADPLEQGSAVAFMGGIELDLSAATIDGGARLNLKAMMGGIDVTVPADWRVEVISQDLAGGIENLTDPDEPTDGPLLIIDATAIMGGIMIHNPKAADGG